MCCLKKIGSVKRVRQAFSTRLLEGTKAARKAQPSHHRLIMVRLPALLLCAGGSVLGAGPDLIEQCVRFFDEILDLVVIDSIVVEGRSLQNVPHLAGQRIASIAPGL